MSPELEEEVKRLREENRSLRKRIDRLTACPGCGKHPAGAHFCPGPERERYAWSASQILGTPGEYDFE